MKQGHLFSTLGKGFLYLGLMAFVFVLAICCSSSIGHNTASKAELPKKKDSFTEVNLLFAGDVMMHLPEINAARVDSADGFDFSPFFQYIAPIVKKADIAVANLETTFGGKPYKGYPQFSAPDTLAWFLKRAGFNLMVTANNHAADRGEHGVIGTIDGLNRAGLVHTGTFKDSADRAKTFPYMIEKKGIRFAFLNYTYGTNGLKVPPPAIINYIDTTQIKLDIAMAHTLKADAIIVVFHWGIEYQRMPNEEQKQLARFCLEQGIDVVIGSHPHVVQPAFWQAFRKKGDTVDRKGLVLYSLGNYVSAQRDRYKDGAIMFSFTVKKNKFTKAISIEKPNFEPTWVYVRPKSYTILPANIFEADTNFVRLPAEREQMMQSYKDNRAHMMRDSIPWLQEMK